MAHINGSGCWMTALGMFTLWLLVASALLWLTWNRVLGTLIKVKTTQYWQSLLFLTTVCSLLAPCWYIKMHNKECNSRHNCYTKDGLHEKGDCPYSRSKGKQSENSDKDSEKDSDDHSEK